MMKTDFRNTLENRKYYTRGYFLKSDNLYIEEQKGGCFPRE